MRQTFLISIALLFASDMVAESYPGHSERIRAEIEAKYRAQGGSLYLDASRKLQSEFLVERTEGLAELVAFFRQGPLTEKDARADWKGGKGREDPQFREAFRLRQRAAEDVVASTCTVDALPIASVFLNERNDDWVQTLGIQLVACADDAAIEPIVASLLDPPHPNLQVILGALEIVRDRKLTGLGPAVRGLSQDYRIHVRERAREVGAGIGITDFPAFDPREALKFVENDLRGFAAMVATGIPAGTPWVLLPVPADTNEFPDCEYPKRKAGRPTDVSGWLLEETDSGYLLLDYYGIERRLPKQVGPPVQRNLVEEAARPRGDEREMPPSLLPAAWALMRGDRAAAAALALPIYRSDDREIHRFGGFDMVDGLPVSELDRRRAAVDPRDVREAAVEELGRTLRVRLMRAYSLQRDYPQARQLATKFSNPFFDGYWFQSVAARLVEQLAEWQQGSGASFLVTKKEWERLRGSLTTLEQVEYLVAHIRDPIPAAVPAVIRTYEDGAGFLDPMSELHSMVASGQLLPAALSPLVSSLEDDRFVPGPFEFDRGGFSDRWWTPVFLRPMSALAAEVINSAVKRRLIDLDVCHDTDASGRRKCLDDIATWVREHQQASEMDLYLEILSHPESESAWSRAAYVLAEKGDTRALPLLLKRAKEDPEWRRTGTWILYQMDSAELVPPARVWLAEANRKWEALSDAQKVAEARDGHLLRERLLLAMMLLRRGDRAHLEGFNTIRSVLEADQEGSEYFMVSAELLSLGKPKATELLMTVLEKPGMFDDFVIDDSRFCCWIFSSGNRKFIDMLQQRLSEMAPEKCGIAGADSDVEPTTGDRVARLLAGWTRGDNEVTWDLAETAEKRAAKRRQLSVWLENQHALAKAGKPNDISDGACAILHRRLPNLPKVR